MSVPSSSSYISCEYSGRGLHEGLPLLFWNSVEEKGMAKNIQTDTFKHCSVSQWITNHASIMYSCMNIAVHTTLCFSFLGTFATLRIGSISFDSSVCPHGMIRLPMNGFSWNLVLEDCSKIRLKIKIWLKLCNNDWYFSRRQVHLLYLFEFFLEW
jgi:hypothetical protein